MSASLTGWSSTPADDVDDELGDLRVALAEVSCSCAHRFEHDLEVLRVRDTGTVLGFRLGVCRVRYCRCRGGRS